MPSGHTPIGPGEFQRADQPNALAQFSYLQTISRLEPAVLRELADIAKSPINEHGRVQWLDPIRTLDAAAINAWAVPHHLEDGWLRATAAATVNWWRMSPFLMERLPLQSASLGFGVIGDWPALTWNPLIMTRAAAETMVREYLDGFEALAAERGYVRSASIRDDSALEWLVRYQVCEEPKAEIAASIRGKRRLEDSVAEIRNLARRLSSLAGLLSISLRRERARRQVTSV